MIDTFSNKAKYFLKQYDLQLIAIFISLLLSGITLSYHQPFNVDGILYLKTASAFLHGGLRAALTIYNWPFYSILIAVVSKLTYFSLENSAFILNTIFNTITILVFISLIKELGGSQKTQLFGTILILIYPFLTHDRDNILRDFGFYAFAMLSFLFYLRFLHQLNWKNAIAWSTSILIAMLFRIEGMVFFVIAPFIIFFLPNLNIKQRFINLFKLHAVGIACVLFVLGWLIFHYQDENVIVRLGRLTEPFMCINDSIKTVVSNFQSQTGTLQKTLLFDLNHNFASTFLLAGTIGIFLDVFIRTTGIIYLILAFYALRHRLIPIDIIDKRGWFAYIFLNVLIIGFFLISKLFLAERYITFLCLLLILATPFSLVKIYQGWKAKKSKAVGKKWFFPFVVILLILTAVESIGHFGTSKTYIVKAGSWLNQQIPEEAYILTNDAQLSYYSHRTGFADIQFHLNDTDALTSVRQNDITNYDYVALVIHHNQDQEEKEIINLLKKQPIAIFKNKKGDKALVFKVF